MIHRSQTTRKFLCCFPLRLGNMIFGYFISICSLAVIAFNLYQLGLNMESPLTKHHYNKFKHWRKLEDLFGENSVSLLTVRQLTMIYHISYIIVAFLMFLFSAFLTCGACSLNYCLVLSFFIYSFFHLLLTVFLIVWEATTEGWIELGLLIGSDLILIMCLCSVAFLMSAIRTGNIYKNIIHEKELARNFLCCFPLRIGNLLFGYFVLICSLAVIAFNLYQLGLNMASPLTEHHYNKFKHWRKLEDLFGENSESLLTVRQVTMIYHISYIIVAFLMFLFSAFLTCGACSVINCLVSSFFIYSFFHLLLTVFLIVWEATTEGWIELGLLIGADLILIVCLISVAFLMGAIRSGNLYSQSNEYYHGH